MRPPTRTVSTRRRWRLFKPWMEKPCSRVLRKFSGELTTIQYWAFRAVPDLRLRLDRPDFAGRSGSLVDSPIGSSGTSATSGRLLAVRGLHEIRGFALISRGPLARPHRPEVLRFGEQGAEVADLADVAHLVLRDHPAHVEQRQLGTVRVRDAALPFGLAPAMEKVDGAPAHAGEVLQRLLERPGQLLVVAWVDGRADVSRGLAVEVSVPQQGVDARRGIDKVGDQAAEGGEGRAMPVPQPPLV